MPSYPKPPTTGQVDDYHGTIVADPYRPLEDSDAAATRVVPEATDALEHVGVVGGRLALAYLRDAHSRLAIVDLDGRNAVDVELPGIGSITELSGRRRDDDLYVAFTTFASPSTVLAVRMANGDVRKVPRPDLAWDPDHFITEQVFVASADGTRIPLFLTRRRDVTPDAKAPTLVHGYGGFNIPTGPGFKPEWLAWLHNIRAGTAYPPTLVTTGDHDDRVVPGHSFKFAAALQAAQAGDAPILMRIDTDAGHGLGKPVGKLIDERADVLTFLELALA